MTPSRISCATFEVAVLAARRDVRALGMRRAAGKQAGGRSPVAKPRVLVVDDFEIGRKLAERRLVTAGFGVKGAASGEEALRIAASDPPDAILSDKRMPGMDGLQLLAAIRRNPVLAHIPVVLVSGAGLDDSEVQQLRELRGSCVVRTPDMTEAIAALTAALDEARHRG